MADIPTLNALRLGLSRSKAFSGTVAEAAANAISELDGVKMDKSRATSVMIPTEGWQSDDNADYPLYYDMAVEGVTAKDFAVVAIQEDIDALGIKHLCETIDGAVRIRTNKALSSVISATIWILGGE